MGSVRNTVANIFNTDYKMALNVPQVGHITEDMYKEATVQRARRLQKINHKTEFP